jgi:hypothetical protein
MTIRNSKAELYLNGIHVGHVTAHGVSASWEYGDFTPTESFSKFAGIFGVWSLLIHDKDGRSRMSPEALEELREAEAAIDSLRAELRWINPAGIDTLEQVNIDGALIEWKRR